MAATASSNLATLHLQFEIGRNLCAISCDALCRFAVSEDGPTAVEYAVMLALIIIVCLAAVKTLGTNAKTTFTRTANSIRQLAPFDLPVVRPAGERLLASLPIAS